MSEPAYVTWMIDRDVSKGRLRIGVLAGRVVVELAGRRLALPNTDILSVADVASSRATAPLARSLREGGYSHLLGGQVALRPGEAQDLREAARGSPEGLALRRARLVAALAREEGAAPADGDTPTGLTHHTDGLEMQVSEARRALNAFDRAHPQIVAAIVAAREAGG